MMAERELWGDEHEADRRQQLLSGDCEPMDFAACRFLTTLASVQL